MPISVRLGELAQDAQESGALDPAQVWYQFVCTTAGGHDPEQPPDSHVRPAHAALHGTCWRVGDPSAPVPPLDFGCRCAMRYVAAPGTPAARVLPDAPVEKPEADPAAPYVAYLDDHAPKWSEITSAAAKAPSGQEMPVAFAVAKDLGYPRDIARLALLADPPPAKAAPAGLGALTGIGPTARRLAAAWIAGDKAAGEKLRRSYPATWARLLEETPDLPR